MSFGLVSAFAVFASHDSILHIVHHLMVHFELQDGHSVHKLDLLDEELRSLPLVLFVLRVLLVLENERIKVIASSLLVFHLLSHHDFHVLSDLRLVFLVIVLAIKLLNVWKVIVLCDGSDNLVGQVEQLVDLPNPKSLLVEKLELHSIEAKVVEYIAVSKH